MSDLFGNMMSGIVAGTDRSQVPQSLRQRVALALLMKKQAYPKTLGEGLASIGDSLGDAWATRAIEREAAAAEAAGAAARSDVNGTPPATSAPTGYAPPDSVENEPGPAAINRAAPITPPAALPPPPPGVLAPPPDMTNTPAGQQPPSTMFSPQRMQGVPGLTSSRDQIAGMLDPRQMTSQRVPPPDQQIPPGTSPADGGYNMIDAQAGFKRPTPGYMQDTITRNVADPDRQAYLGSLVGGEAPRGPADVSPTGADGPFQFTRGTGRQYGLIGPQGDQRRDLDASVQAADRLTNDNAAAFQRLNGRPPSPADLAVLHQQGGVTGSRMIAGTGNAPAGNLAVNNIPPGTSPDQAVAKIKSYYGMPDQATGTQRNAIAQQLATGQQQGGPDQRLAFNGSTPPAPPAAAPPPQQPITSAPPQQPIQSAPQAVPPAGYVRDIPPEPVPPPTMTPLMQRIQQKIDSTPASQRDSVKEALAPTLANEQAKLAQEQAIYKDKVTQRHEAIKQMEDQKATAAGRVVEVAKETEAVTKARDENRLRAQFANLPPEEVFKKVNESHKIAKSGQDALVASAAAMKAFKDGAITGYGADQKLNVAKLFTALNLTDKGNLIANTETFKSAMQPVVAAILHQTSGTSQLSEGELAFAKQAAAGNISLDAKTIPRLMEIIDKRSREVIKDHQTLTSAMFGDDPKAKAVYGVDMPPSQEDSARKWLQDNPNDPRAPAIKQKLGIR